MDQVGLTGLMQIDFPSPTGTVRISDGGFQVWGSDTFVSADAVFGAISSVEALGEGVGDEVPALELVLMPPGASEPGDVTQPGFQTSRTRFWIAEYDLDDHSIVGAPDLLFDGQVDRTVLKVGASRELSISVVSLAERLFARDMGNSLNPTFHKSVWPGELGHDNATGLSVPVAWGAEKPPSAGGGSYTPNPYGEGTHPWLRRAA